MITQREEWLRLMLEIAALDRDAYRMLRAQAWGSVVRTHEQKTQAELSAWKVAAS